jgi:hypothetical protein
MEDPVTVIWTVSQRYRHLITSKTSNLGRMGDRDTYGDTLNFEDAGSSQYAQNPALSFFFNVGTGVSDVSQRPAYLHKIEPQIDTDQVTGRARSEAGKTTSERSASSTRPAQLVSQPPSL